ncbi:MAG TPA: GDSL-type esterase/lipase family protein [Verrucomicrobiae bacterium]|nr:GDSL-type esterase/lipase family protein [Verrucomicrobiae bacterium]
MNKKLAILIAAITTILIVVFLVSSNSRDVVPEGNFAKTGTNIIFFGDSLVEGVGASSKNDLVSVLSEMIDEPIINAGVSGDTTRTALVRINEDVLSKDPKVVIVLLGGNDYLLRYPKEETENNMITIIDQIRSKNAAVLVVGVNDGYYEDVTRSKGVSYVPTVLKDILFNKDLMSDSIHPNDKGYKLMAERIAPTLKQILNK